MLHHSDIRGKTLQIRYIEELIDSFEQIDVNGDKTLEWDEFSNYIVEIGIGKQKQNFVEYIRNYHHVDFPLYKPKHDNNIYKVFFFSKIKHLLVLEFHSKKLKVYNYETGRVIQAFDAHEATVTCCEYLESSGFIKGLVVTSGSDNTLRFWDPHKDYKLVKTISTREIQLVMKWVKSKKMLVTGGFDCVINCYRNLEFEEYGKLKNPLDLFSMKREHEHTITDILVIEHLNLIIACDCKQKITIFNLQSLELKAELKEHQKGLVALAFLEKKNLLLSAGYEHEVFVWDIVVGKKISALQGHSQSLIGVKVFPGTYQIITGDVAGIFKIWDYRSMTAVQTFSIPSSMNKRAFCFCVTHAFKKKIIIGAEKMYFYEYEESREGNLADSKSCLTVIYNEVFNTFVTAHIDSIKIWDATTGVLKQVFRNITDDEISNICFDKRKRKLFIGDVQGRLFLINILNGVQMKTFSKHLDYISSMTYFYEGKKFITASWDGNIKIHDDDSADEKGQLLFEFAKERGAGRRNSCNSIDFSDKLNILASGFDNGIVTLTNMKSFSSEGTLNDHGKVKLVYFLRNFSSIIVCDNAGSTHYWTLIPTKPKKIVKDILTENLSINENNRKEFFPVKCIEYEHKNDIILSGDETGHIKAYNIKAYVDYLKLIEAQQKRGIYYAEVSSLNKDFVLEDAEGNYNTVEKLMAKRDQLDLQPKLVKEWKAHRNGVTSVTSNVGVDSPVFYASSGLDCKVLIWNEEFELIRALTTLPEPGWYLQTDIDYLRQKRKERSELMYDYLQEFNYQNLFTGTVKPSKLVDDSSEDDLP